jgi:toxin ParE1/3/4
MTAIFSPAASDDLMKIALFIAEDNPQRALSFIEELEDTCHLLSRSPGIGTVRTDLGKGVRSMPHGRYLIFYRRRDDETRIERIFHGSRDIRRSEVMNEDDEPSSQ